MFKNSVVSLSVTEYTWEIFRLARMDCVALHLFPLCQSYSKNVHSKSHEPQVLMLPMPAEETVPE